MRIATANYLILLLILLPLSFKLQAQEAQNPTSIGVTHPQVKQVIEDLSAIYKWNIRPVMAFQIKGSAHSSEPSMHDLKRLMKHSYLIAGPTGHQRWIKKISSHLPKNTFFLKAKAQDHFWLDVELACKTEETLIATLVNWKLISKTKDMSSDLWCKKVRRESKELASVIEKANITHVILAHDALRPLLESLGLRCLVLFRDDHHTEVTSGVLRKALIWQQSKIIRATLLHVNEPESKWPSPLVNHSIKSVLWSPLEKKPFRHFISLLEKIKAQQ